MTPEQAFQQALSLSKIYTKKSLEGAGALVGKNVIISSIAPIDGGNRVTFSYTLDNGTPQTSYMDVMDGKDGKQGEPGADGADGVSITGIEKTGADGLADTYQISFSDGSTFDYGVKNGAQGLQGLRGDKGDKGDDGQQGLQGIKGDKGDDGYPFLIYKQYDSLPDFSADDFPEIGLLFMVMVKDENDSFPVYRYTGNGENPYSYVTGLSNGEAIKGDKGDPGSDGEQGVPGVAGQDGTTYQPTIGTVTAGDTASASVVTDDEAKTAEFSFVLPKGDKGDSGKSAYETAIENGFEGTEEEWIESMKGADGKDGKSIKKLEVNEDGDLIATFTDDSTENLGKIDINVEADFLTFGGFGNLRYYQGKLEYFDTATENWVKTSVTPDNIYIINMMPQIMKYVCGQYDVKSGHYRIMFEEPADTVIDGQVACVVEKVVIRRKLGSDPQNENDGTLVATITRPNFGTYKDDWYVDSFFTPNMGEEWYYKLFPISTTGFANMASDNSTGGILAKDYYLFEFQIGQSESDPDSMITYASDNAKFKKAFMDYTLDKFNYGSWKDAFFMPKTCMLNTDGTVAYYLNPMNEELKVDGTPSDVANPDFDGNAMVEFPKIFWKKSGDSGYAIASKKVDDDFKCWSNIDANGDEIEHFYMPMYDGSLINGRLRSLSGQTPMSDKTRQQELDYAHANNPDGVHIYETHVFCDVQLFRILCLLISGTTNSKKAFGTGNNNSYVSTSNTGVKKTGTTNGKGMFWGNQDNKSCVRVFYMENPWGNIWKSCAGWINDKGVQKVKMTYGQSDGSTVDGYNTTGAGYITIADATPNGTSGGYISNCKFDEHGLIPKQASGSATTKYCDGLWFDNSQVDYALVGGASNAGLSAGALCSTLTAAASLAGWYVGAAISCKPLASIQGGN